MKSLSLLEIQDVTCRQVSPRIYNMADETVSEYWWPFPFYGLKSLRPWECWCRCSMHKLAWSIRIFCCSVHISLANDTKRTLTTPWHVRYTHSVARWLLSCLQETCWIYSNMYYCLELNSAYKIIAVIVGALRTTFSKFCTIEQTYIIFSTKFAQLRRGTMASLFEFLR